MALTDAIGPYARRVMDDDDLRDQLLRAGRAGRGALRPKPVPRPTRVKRAGAALHEAGAAVGALGEIAERRRRARRRGAVLRVTLLGGAAAAGAGAVLRRRSGSGAEAAPRSDTPTTQERTVNG